MFKINLIKSNNIYTIVFFCILLFWISNLNTNLLYLVKSPINIKNITTISSFIDFIKTTLIPLFILFIGLISFYFFFKRKKLFKNNFVNIFIVYNIISCIGLFLSNNSFSTDDYIYNISFSFFFLCYLVFLKNIVLEKNCEYIIYINIFLIIIYLLYYLNSNQFYYGDIEIKYLNNQITTNSGAISKYLVILQIFLFSVLYFNKNINNFLKNSLLIFLIIIFFLIFCLESRLNTFLIILISFLIIFFTSHEKKIKFIKNLIILIISLSMYFFYTYNYPSNSNYKESRVQSIIKKLIEEKKIHKKYKFEEILYNESFKVRLNTWKFLINHNKKNLIFGNGHQYDRWILQNKQYPALGTEAANAIVYVFLSAGFFGILLLFTFYYQIITNIYFYYLNKYKIKFLTNFCIFTSIYFIFRSLVEVSFVSWGTDAILLFANMTYLVIGKHTK